MIKKNYISLHVSTHFAYQVWIKLEFCRKISKSTPIPNFMKIRPVGAELYAEEHIDRYGSISRSSQYRKRA